MLKIQPDLKIAKSKEASSFQEQLAELERKLEIVRDENIRKQADIEWLQTTVEKRNQSRNILRQKLKMKRTVKLHPEYRNAENYDQHHQYVNYDKSDFYDYDYK